MFQFFIPSILLVFSPSTFIFACIFWLQSEEERLRDQRERQQLEQHIRERDAVSTRKVQ